MTVQTIKPPEVVAPSEEIESITRTITGYMEAWYGAGHGRLIEAIRPTIVKQKFYLNPDTGTLVLRETTAHQLLEIAKDCAAQGPRPTPSTLLW